MHGLSLSPPDLVLVTSGAPTADGGREFIAPGYMAVADGRVVRALERNVAVGEKLLAQLAPGETGARRTVTSLRGLAPSAEEIAFVEQKVKALGDAGIALDIPDARAFLAEALARAVSQSPTSWSPWRLVAERLFAKVIRFPEVYWSDDPEPGIEEAEEVLGRLSLPNDLPRMDLMKRADALLAEEDAAEDAPIARDRFTAVLAGEINERLRAAGRDERLVEFSNERVGDDDPLWLAVTPAQAEVISRELLSPAPSSSPPSAAAQPQPVSDRSIGGKRLAAKAIDLATAGLSIAGFAKFIGAVPAVIVGCGWLLVSDWNGSLGKLLLKLQVRDAQSGTPCTLYQSVIRNMTLVPALIVRSLPLLFGLTRPEFRKEHPTLFLSSAVLSLILIAYEANPARRNGARLGDRLAGTVVRTSTKRG